MSEEKIRLDMLVVQKQLASSREKAREYILTGKIYVNGEVEKKCGLKVKCDVEVEMRGEAIPYVSRGGLKLHKALKDFSIDLNDSVCLDIGASTGGFTECMLKNGAQKVFAIDVGRDQLAEKLRQDSRVVSMEGTNIRNITPEDIGELCDFASIDVSFISLDKVIPHVLNLLKEKGQVVALIKPQFEAGRGKVSKKGVVKNSKIHEEVILNIINLLKENNATIIDLNYSGIKGPNGNIEYLINFTKDSTRISNFSLNLVTSTVKVAHDKLNSEDI
ncbi:MAG: TlyA family RNA methyltransferase [Clostridium sp.]|nr:TlyA family RNA methyltransferase [Clostridium sp.]MDU7084479.1 TlyA family RNA methyltransferase [Clostridium sp.]